MSTFIHSKTVQDREVPLFLQVWTFKTNKQKKEEAIFLLAQKVLFAQIFFIFFLYRYHTIYNHS